MQEIADSYLHGWLDPKWTEKKQRNASQKTITQSKKISNSL